MESLRQYWENNTWVNSLKVTYTYDVIENLTEELTQFWRESLTIVDTKTLPKQFKLSQNYPNPFNPTTTIKFSIPRSGMVTLTIYDVLGRQVETILNRRMQAGHHIAQWNASDVPSGIYFVRMLHRSLSETSGDFSQVRKAMVVQ